MISPQTLLPYVENFFKEAQDYITEKSEGHPSIESISLMAALAGETSRALTGLKTDTPEGKTLDTNHALEIITSFSDEKTTPLSLLSLFQKNVAGFLSFTPSDTPSHINLTTFVMNLSNQLYVERDQRVDLGLPIFLTPVIPPLAGCADIRSAFLKNLPPEIKMGNQYDKMIGTYLAATFAAAQAINLSDGQMDHGSAVTIAWKTYLVGAIAAPYKKKERPDMTRYTSYPVEKIGYN